ncbi:hypothetical protein C5167_002492 [Papaver somniferum]|uniref:Uncharacterized protein n=1 Tax=Papaver somniferum TaxID=3469 RepID=A0A4Y7L0W9_PAPSO|nr:hypothetical protein C5167_002492 [Papaver somniferum]
MHYIHWDWFSISKNKGGLGLESLEQLNKAFVTELTWRFLADPSALWCKLLRAKYFKSTNIWAAKTPQKCSSSWQVCSCHVAIVVILAIQIVYDIYSKVNELLIPKEGTWNIPLLHELYYSYEAEQILKLHITKGART